MLLICHYLTPEPKAKTWLEVLSATSFCKFYHLLLKMKEFRVTKYLASVAKVPMEVLEEAIRLSYETDKALKSEPSDAWVLLDMLAVRIYAPKSLRKG